MTDMLEILAAAMAAEAERGGTPSGSEVGSADGWKVGDGVRVLHSCICFSSAFEHEDKEKDMRGVISSVRTGGYDPLMVWVYSPITQECYPFEPFELEKIA